MTAKISELCDSILKKAHEFVAVGDFSAVTEAAEAIKAVASINLPSTGTEDERPSVPVETEAPEQRGGHAPPVIDEPESGRTSPEPVEVTVDHDKVIAETLALGFGYDADEWKFMERQWVSTAEAAAFGELSPDTVRNWCDEGVVVCRQDPTKRRKSWLVCPRSVALRVNKHPDPRIGNE